MLVLYHKCYFEYNFKFLNSYLFFHVSYHEIKRQFFDKIQLFIEKYFKLNIKIPLKY